jgi:hypothetical protein
LLRSSRRWKRAAEPLAHRRMKDLHCAAGIVPCVLGIVHRPSGIG